MIFYKKSLKLVSFTFVIIFLLIAVNLIPSGECSRETIFDKWRDRVYYSYDELTDLIDQLQKEYPDTFLYYSLGKTYEGRDIWLVKISDNVTIDEDEPEVLFNGGKHGNEKPGYQVVIYTLKSIVENYTSVNVNESFTMRIRNVVNNTELYFIPIVNPDGVEAVTRKNRRPTYGLFGKTPFYGVDINRNYAYKWEELDKHHFKYIFGGFPRWLSRTTVKYPLLDFKSIFGGGTYRGPYPFSENESKAIKHFIENHNIRIRIDYHIFGEKILYPWSWTKNPPDDEPIFISIAENISKINGYEVTQGSKWYYIPGSSGDWLYANHSVFPFTIELCKSSFPVFFPIKSHILKICKTHLLVNLYIAERAITIDGFN